MAVSTWTLVLLLLVCCVAWWATNYWAAEIGTMGKFLRFVIILVAAVSTILWAVGFVGALTGHRGRL
jgi:hypothetical protein